MRSPTLLLAALVGGATARFDAQVFLNATENYHTFRIPGLIKTTKGTLIALAEGRARMGFNPPGGDTVDCYGEGASARDDLCTNKDAVYKRSYDNGRTWSPVTLFSTPGGQQFGLANDTYFYSNLNGVVDPRTGSVWVQYARCVAADVYNACQPVIVRSDDDGSTWSEVAEPVHPLHICGVSGGILTTAGRLLFPCHGTGEIYSDDQGATWLVGQPVVINGTKYEGENMIAELDDGRGTLVMTMRQLNNTRRLFSSADGGVTWADPVLQAVTDPNCQASMIAVWPAGGGASTLLFANPHTSGLLPYAQGRQNVTVQVSRDAGATWSPLLLVDDGPSAYTALAQLLRAGAGPESCAILYEESADLPVDFRSIRFTAFDCATGA